MESFGIGGMAGLGALGAAGVAVTALRVRLRRRRAAARRAPAVRLESLAAAQAELSSRLDALSAEGGEAKLQAMAGQLIALIRDKNAAMETAMAGLDQLRTRMRALEQIGEPAEARALVEKLGERLDALQAAQAALDARLGAVRSGEAPVAALAERLAKLHDQKDAGLIAALGRLAPLESKLAALEGGLARLQDRKDPGLEAAFGRIGALEQAVAARAPQAGLDGIASRLEALEAENPFGEISGQLTRLYAQKDAAVEAVLGKLGPLETKLAELTAAEPRALLDRFAERLEAVQARVGALEAAENPFGEVSEQLTRLYAQKDAAVEAVLGKLAPLEEKLAELAATDPRAALDGFAARLEAVQGRLGVLEAAENPFAEISEQLTRLYAQKDAAVEAVLGKLAPLEAKLGELERGHAERDPQVLLDRFAERLEAVRGALDGRVAALEDAETPFAAISEQLTRLYAQKDAGVEAMLGRLGPLEAKLDALERGLAERGDPQVLLDRFAERLEAVRGALDGRVAVLEDAENPFAAISEQLTRLYAQKDAGVEAMLGRLGPLEEKLGALERGLAERDPQVLLDRFAERLEAVRGALDGRVAVLEDAENPFAAISEQLTRLYAQKDAGVEAMLGRLGPLEEKLGALERGLAERDPQALLDRFAERLEAVQGRVGALEAAENPFAEISEQLTRLYAQKDAGVEAMLGRLAPLEAKLDALEGGLAKLAPLLEADPRGELDGLAARVAELNWAQGEIAAGLAALKAAGEGAPFAEIAGQLTRLYAQRDAIVETVLAKLAPLEARLAALEGRPWDPDADEARAQAQAIAAQLIAARAASEQISAETGPFADRLALLEASLPQLSAAQALMVQVLEARVAAPEPAPPAGRATGWGDEPLAEPSAAAVPAQSAPAPADPEPAAADLDEIWSLPRLISLHRK